MGEAARAVALDDVPAQPARVLEELVLARAAVENGATRADMLRDLAPLTSQRLSPSELRNGIDNALEALLIGKAISGVRGRYRLLAPGEDAVAARFGARKAPASWAEMRDTRIVGEALGAASDGQVLKALGRPDGLRALILQKHFKVGGKRALGSSRLRMALAVIALERAFGNKIKSGLDAGRGLSVKASRLLAGQLARRPRDFGTDTRLVATLAAEAVGATQTDPGSLRTAILRRYVSERLGGGPPAPEAPSAAVMDVPAVQPVPNPGQPPNDNAPSISNADAAAQRPPAASRPGLEGFVRAVLNVADGVAEGWPGNRKALIARVWQAIDTAHPEWGLSDIEFKGMLAEAHRTGNIVLGSADLKSKDNLKDVQASAIAYKNTVWHFIRV